jgi:hypothetical protein
MNPTLHVVLLRERGQLWAAPGYVLASVVVALSGLVGGLSLMRMLAG